MDVFAALWMFFASGLSTKSASDQQRMRRAYTAAWKHREATDADDSTALLFAQMKAANVPGVYTEPYNRLILAGFVAWAQGMDPKAFRTYLRDQMRQAEQAT